jgi:BirA family biotin operon repressor/biotin-[acetyl-CoA-carboxylase] ligase
MSAPHFGRVTHALDSTPSTQDEARAHVERHGASVAGELLTASRQTAGRGRQGRAWFTPPGANFCGTFIGLPVPISELWQVAFVAAVAAADAVTAAAPDMPVHLRFPNDVLLSGKKVSGILVETANGPDVPPGAAMPLIGIGINVRGGTEIMPPEVAVRATTLEAETGREISVGLIGGLLITALNTRWSEWRTGDGFATTLKAWQKYHNPDARRAFVIGGVPTSCRVLSVSPDGNVIVELPDASRQIFPVAHILLSG